MTADTWRGVAAEDTDQVTGKLSALLRRRGRRLLTSLLRPHRGRVAVTLALIVTANLAALAGPWLVGLAIDLGLPPLLHAGDIGPLAGIVAAFGVAVAVQAIASRAFIFSMGQLGETGVLELRRRLFAHFQRLPVAFHERYTSGRVISRQTSDIDSISDLFEDGLDSLVSAVFSLVLVVIAAFLYLPDKFSKLQGVTDSTIHNYNGNPRLIAIFAVIVVFGPGVASLDTLVVRALGKKTPQ